ncbi:MAG: glycosyltransferase family 4 protein [bacterium]
MSNIGMVLESNFPHDNRVEKEARALISAGHKVFLLVGNKRDDQKEEEEIKGIFVRRISQKNLWKQKINYARFLLTLYDDFFARQMSRFIDDFEIKLLHVNDLLLVGTALPVCRACRIPIVADLHEADYPALVEIYGHKIIKEKIFLNARRWEKYEKKWLQDVDKILVVVEEAQKMLETKGIDGSKIHVVSNTEEIDYFKNFKFNQEILTGYRDCFAVSYVGGFGPHRGLDTIIKSAKYLKGEIKNIKLLLVGGGHDKVFDLQLKDLSKQEGAEDLVEFCGWHNFNNYLTFIKASRICLVPYHRSGHTDTTVPHKLFQYMIMKKPIIASSCAPLIRIVNETGCGLVFQAGSARDLADRILAIYRDSDNYGKNGRKAVEEKYNWEVDGRSLVRLYNSLL